MSSFRVGQKVVFVDDSGINDPRIVGNKYGFIFPTKGGVYTVRAIVTSDYTAKDLLLLVEIDNRDTAEATGWLKEPGAEASRFRPVVERKTDISIFTDMLKTQRTRISA